MENAWTLGPMPAQGERQVIAGGCRAQAETQVRGLALPLTDPPGFRFLTSEAMCLTEAPCQRRAWTLLISSGQEGLSPHLGPPAPY